MSSFKIYKNIAETIKRVRKFKGLSQTEIAELCGLTRDMVAKVELAKTNKLDNYVCICDVLGIKITLKANINIDVEEELN